MKKILLFFILISVSGCASIKNPQNGKRAYECNGLVKKGFSEILSEKYITTLGTQKVEFNQVRFQCVYGNFYTHKVMYDAFGKWDKAIFPSNNSRYPILVWKDVDLLSDGKKYNVYTEGREVYKDNYASIMVFDENDLDLLKEESTSKEKIVDYFANAIRNLDLNFEEFGYQYWSLVDSSVLRRLK